MYDYQRLCREIEFLSHRYSCCRLSSAGKSLCGRSLPLLEMGEGKKAVLYAGAFHGMEWITSALLMHFCRRLCQAQESGITVSGTPVRSLLKKITFYCLPMVNPDGVEISLKGPELAGICLEKPWGNTARWQANARGVDINHNFDAGWHTLRKMEGTAGITGPGPTRYGGTAPESEPETAAVASLCRRVSFSLVMAFHSQGEEIYWQYGTHTPAVSQELALEFARLSGYQAAQPEPMASMGGFKDWFIEEFHRPGFTIEVGKGKNPLPFSQLASIEFRLFPMMMWGLTVCAQLPEG